ncbi:Protein kinase-like domain protein [Niveomyces insectorum RCEF 264]|uniref:EKC/KEOPS complex subunit BUD32 n=1 Tax=Niveomyces insectorum RCEF 264 TaxID=1081102 RepID=A0A167YXC0_9HYPO|nr:Protein kinase-like domain protein [Niveomyces insectorum RCEF 264]
MSVTNLGNTSSVIRVRPGVVEKRPHNYKTPQLQDSVATSFAVERQILEHLGDHPRIVRYLGQSPDDPRALLLGEASHSDLQTYLDKHPEPPPPGQALRWCRQAAEAVAYIHSRGVLHCDLRPANLLVERDAYQSDVDDADDADDHGASVVSLSLRLADFGGSVCSALSLDGGGLASTPFWHPVLGHTESVALDLFGLGSLMYVIFTARWPYKDTPGRPGTIEAREAYEALVDPLLLAEQYPRNVDCLPVGAVIRRCWTRGYATADEVVQDLAGVFVGETTRREVIRRG